MFRINDNPAQPIRIDQDVHDEFMDEHGSLFDGWVNETTNKYSVYNTRINASGRGNTRYSLSGPEVDIKKTVMNTILDQDSQVSSSEMDVWSQVDSTFYNTSPQNTLESFQEARRSNQLTFFDMETLGSIDSSETNVFTPTEIAFQDYTKSFIKQDGKIRTSFDSGEATGLLIAPDDETYNTLNNWVEKAGSRGILPNSDQQRTITDLMKYAGDIHLEDGTTLNGLKTSNGLVEQHAEWISAFKDQVSRQGNIDFSQTQTFTYNGRQISIDPVKQAKEGLNNLTRQGEDPLQAAKAIRDHIKSNDYNNNILVGHNSAKFDLKGINKFLNNHGLESVGVNRHLDTLQLFRSAFESPSQASETLGFNIQDSKQGLYSLENLFPQVLGKTESHVAIDDARGLAELFLNTNDKIQKQVLGLKNKGTGMASGYNQGEFLVNEMPLQKGDKLISTGGLRQSSPFVYDEQAEDYVLKSQYEMRNGVPVPKDPNAKLGDTPYDFVVGSDYKGNIGLLDKPTSLNSKAVYEVAGFREAEVGGQKLYGVELYNEVTDDMHFINRPNKSELEDIIHSRFNLANDMSSEAINEVKSSYYRGLARDRYRKLFSTRQGGGYWTLRRFRDATDELHGWMDDKGLDWSSNYQENLNLVDDFMGDRRGKLAKIFSLDGMGQEEVLESYFRDFKYTAPRLSSEYGMIDKMINRVNNKLGDGITDYKIDPTDQAYNNLLQEEKMGNLNLKKSAAIRNAYEEITGEMRSHKKFIKMPEYQQNALKLPNSVGKKTITLGSIDETVSDLNIFLSQISQTKQGNNDPQFKERYLKKIVDDFLPTEARSETKGMIESMIREGHSGHAVRELASQFNKHQDKFPNITSFEDIQGNTHTAKQQLIVENLSRRSANDTLPDSIEETIDRHIKMTQGMEFNTKVNQSIRFGGHVENMLDNLDKTLQQKYKQVGVSSANMPRKMQDELRRFVGRIQNEADKRGMDLGVGVYDTSTKEAKQLSIAMFDGSRQKGVLGRNIDELDNVGRIDIPLVDQRGYVKFGNMERVAPLGFLERFKDPKDWHRGEIQLSSAFDRIMRPLHKNLNSMMDLAEEGQYGKITNQSRSSVVEGIQSFSGGNDYFTQDNFDLSVSNSPGDQFKHYSIVTDPYFTYEDMPDNNTYYGRDGKPLSSSGGDPIMAKVKAFTNSLEGDASENNIRQIFNDFVGKNANINPATGRGDSLIQGGIMPMIDMRHGVPMGFFNDAGRANMIQMFNLRPLSDNFLEGIRSSEDMTMNQLFGPDTIGPSQDDIAPNVRVGIYDDATIFDEALKYDKDITDPAMVPTMAEDQIIVSNDLEGQVYSVNRKVEEAVGDDLVLNPKMKEAIDNDAEFMLGENNWLYKYTNKQGKEVTETYDKKVEAVVEGITKTDEGYNINLRQQFRMQDGTKLMFGSEKATAVMADQEFIDQVADGDGVKALMSPSFKSHQAWGDVTTGYVKDVVKQINDSEAIKDKVKEARLRKISKSLGDIFGLKTRVDKDSSGNFKIQYNTKAMIEDVSEGGSYRTVKTLSELTAKGSADTSPYALEKLFDDLENVTSDINDVNFDPRTLTHTLTASDVNENWYESGLLSDTGKRGARFGPREIGILEDKGLTNLSGWMEDSIKSDWYTSQGEASGLIKKLQDQYKSLEHFYDPQDFDSNPYQLKTVDDFKPLRKANLEGVLEKGRYEDLSKTILDPNQEGFFLELPKEVKFEIDDEGSTTKLDRIFISKTDPEVLKSGEAVKQEIGRSQVNLYDAISKYHQGDLEWKEARERIQRHGSDYLQKSLKNLTGSKDDMFLDVMSKRFKGSGFGLLKTMNPLVEYGDEMLDESSKLRGMIDDKINKLTQAGKEEQARQLQSRVDSITANLKQANMDFSAEANTVYVGEEKASNLLGVDQKYVQAPDQFKDEMSEEAYQRISKLRGEGHEGIVNRFPTFHKHSTNGVRVKVSQDVGSMDIKVPNALTKALKGDSDGDPLAIALIDNLDEGIKADIDKNRRMIRSDHGNEIREGIIEGLSKESPKSEMLNAAEGKITMQIGQEAKEQIFKAKATNPALTGLATNVGEKYRELGRVVFDRGSEEAKKLHEGIAEIIQAPISGKHASSSGDVEITKKVKNAIENLRDRNFDQLKEFTVEGERVLDDSHINAFKKLSQKASDISSGSGHDIWQSLATDMHKSTRVMRSGLDDFMKTFKEGQGQVPTKNVDLMSQILGGQARDEFESSLQGIQNRLSETNQIINQPGIENMSTGELNLASSMSKSNGIDEVISSLADSKVGIMGATMLAGASFIAGGTVASSSSNLPMDQVNKPGMQPRSGGSPTVSHVDQSDVSGFDVNINGRAKSTINKDPEELAGIAAETIQGQAGKPMNVQVNATDNRDEVSDEYIKEQIISIVR